MNDELLYQLNNYVQPEDTLYFLGDCTVRNPKWVRENIQCNTIHFILGNHDKEKIIREAGFESVQHVLKTKIHDVPVFLSHYAHRVWNRSHHGTYHLYGHSHNSINNEWGRSMDVGVDAAYAMLGAYRPFSADQIHKILSKRSIKTVDHHTLENRR
jgi:calcineurin-like phosphoesterase family protein